MSSQQLALQLLNGLTFAALPFMLASGFTLIFGLMRIMNLTHGGFYLGGGYVGLTVLVASWSGWHRTKSPGWASAWCRRAATSSAR